MECFRKDVDRRFDEQDTKIDNLTGAIADLGSQIRDYHQEMRVNQAKKQILKACYN